MKITKNELLLYNKKIKNCQFFKINAQCYIKKTFSDFLGYEVPLPGVSGKEVKVDITIKEKIVFPVEEKKILKGEKEYEDLPEDATIHGYSLYEIAAEKVVIEYNL